jgi:tetratricopeptide (TPR) repeat protein
MDKGDYDLAMDYLNQASAIFYPAGKLITLYNIGKICYAKGEYDLAMESLEQAFVIAEEKLDTKNEILITNLTGQVHHARGDHDLALETLNQAFVTGWVLGLSRYVGITLSTISQIHRSRGDYDLALDHLKQSLEARKSVGNICEQAEPLLHMGAIYLEDKNDMVNAVRCLYKSYKIFERMGTPERQQSAAYLDAIVRKIGEERYHAILSELDSGD